MKQTTVTTIEDSDYELLKTWIPEDPCTKCRDSYACCGCPKKREADAAIKPLKEAGIFEVQQKVQEIKELQRKLKEMEQTIESDKNFIAGKGFDLDRIFGSSNSGKPSHMATMNAF